MSLPFFAKLQNTLDGFPNMPQYLPTSHAQVNCLKRGIWRVTNKRSFIMGDHVLNDHFKGHFRLVTGQVLVYRERYHTIFKYHLTNR